jgi:hypothetical protein
MTVLRPKHWRDGWGGIRGKDDRKQNILAPLVQRVKFPRYCVGETVPPLLVNNHSLFVFVSVSLSLFLCRWYLYVFLSLMTR